MDNRMKCTIEFASLKKWGYSEGSYWGYKIVLKKVEAGGDGGIRTLGTRKGTHP